jgi:hypothetical protein
MAKPLTHIRNRSSPHNRNVLSTESVFCRCSLGVVFYVLETDEVPHYSMVRGRITEICPDCLFARCVHCGEHKDVHANGTKCLFHETSFLPTPPRDPRLNYEVVNPDHQDGRAEGT